MKKKNSSTLHRCMLLKKWPMPETCHQVGPLRVRIVPDRMIVASDAIDSTPKT